MNLDFRGFKLKKKEVVEFVYCDSCGNKILNKRDQMKCKFCEKDLCRDCARQVEIYDGHGTEINKFFPICPEHLKEFTFIAL